MLILLIFLLSPPLYGTGQDIAWFDDAENETGKLTARLSLEASAVQGVSSSGQVLVFAAINLISSLPRSRHSLKLVLMDLQIIG